MIYLSQDWAAPEAAIEPAVEWEETNCLLCGGGHWSQLAEAPDAMPGGAGLWFAVVQCQDCGLCFTNPRPSRSCIGQFYPSVYRAHRGSRGPAKRPPPPAGYPTRVRKEQQLRWHGDGRLLDFGCGAGTFLAVMHRRGWQVTGLDMSPAAIYRVRTDLGLDGKIGSLPHSELRPGSFDVITMWESLEHTHNPMEVLREARRLLAPGGKLVITTPNIDSLPFRWFGHAWFGLDLPRHLIHFAPWTLQLMLQRAGFAVGQVRMVRHSLWLRRSTRLANTFHRKAFHSFVNIKPVARLLTWYSYFTRQADCMMVTA